MEAVWVFHGEGGTFPAAVFSTREKAEAWIVQHKVSGCLTLYPVDVAVYEWVIGEGYWKPKSPAQQEPRFIQRFSSAYLEHYHYEGGKECGASVG
jgi:hypothetical protein